MIYLDNMVHRIERRPLGGPTPEAILANGWDADDCATTSWDSVGIPRATLERVLVGFRSGTGHFTAG